MLEIDAVTFEVSQSPAGTPSNSITKLLPRDNWQPDQLIRNAVSCLTALTEWRRNNRTEQ